MQPLRCIMEFFCATFTLGHVHPWTRFTRTLVPFAEFVHMHVRNDRTNSAHNQITVSRIQLLYLHSECSDWSGDIHCNIHTRMIRGNCGTSVSILRSLWNTR